MKILTFDIEEWFHILDNDSTKTEGNWSAYQYRLDENMDRIFELLDKKNQKATFFCLGWVARKFPHILKKIDSLGYEIATHSDTHQLAFEQSPTEFRIDLERSIKSIEDAISQKVKIYRAPGFSIKKENQWVFHELDKQGIEIDCSIFPAKRSHGGFESYGYSEPSIINVNEVRIKELPINLFKFGASNVIFSGGGYFRILPYWLIKSMMKRSDYVMTYFHPRDFDPNQPVIQELSTVRKFKSYVGLKTALNKLEHLITDFDFIDIEQADKLVEWDRVKEIKL
jgi:peptidoglycan-N-acetylglucosamine deacetylase